LNTLGVVVCGILWLGGASDDFKGFDTEDTEERRRKIGEGNGGNAGEILRAA